jgi:hypothetical protein
MDFNILFTLTVKQKSEIFDASENIVDALDVAHAHRLEVTRRSEISNGILPAKNQFDYRGQGRRCGVPG